MRSAFYLTLSALSASKKSLSLLLQGIFHIIDFKGVRTDLQVKYHKADAFGYTILR
jgi:hypothetical protein